MIYLDHNATTQIAPDVLEAMMPYLTTEWGNPSSAYKFGAKLKGVVETAREQVAELIGASGREIVFTSCATESNNAAIHAALKANPGKRHIVTSSVEHSSVLNFCRALEGDHEWKRIHTDCRRETQEAAALHEAPARYSSADSRSRPAPAATVVEAGYRVTYLPVDREGLLKLADLENAITDETALVSLMWANNETGVLSPVKEIAEVCRARGVLFHCDAVQAAGKVGIEVGQVQADYLSLTGHKFYAPKGVGALYVRRKAPFSPLILGGHQERNRRGGTECVPLIVGLGKAAGLARKHPPGYERKVRPLRAALEEGILGRPLTLSLSPGGGEGARRTGEGAGIPNTELNGHKTQRLANTTNITFHGIESEALLILLDQEGICASSGSACLADSDEPSHVVKAMKPEAAASRQMIRFSLGFSREVHFNICLKVADAKAKVLPGLYGVPPADAKAWAARLATFSGEGLCRNPANPKGFSKVNLKQFWHRKG
jgi:cysteine desulfurase